MRGFAALLALCSSRRRARGARTSAQRSVPAGPKPTTRAALPATTARSIGAQAATAPNRQPRRRRTRAAGGRGTSAAPAAAPAAAPTAEDNVRPRARSWRSEESERKEEEARALGELAGQRHRDRDAQRRPHDRHARQRPGVAAEPPGLEVPGSRRAITVRIQPGSPWAPTSCPGPSKTLHAGDAGQVDGRARARLLEMRRATRRS